MFPLKEVFLLPLKQRVFFAGLHAGQGSRRRKMLSFTKQQGGYPARLSSLQSVQSAGIAESDSGIHQITLARVGLRSFSEV